MFQGQGNGYSSLNQLFTCWFRHENGHTKLDNIKTNENEKLIEKLVGLVEKLNERVLILEKSE